MPIRNIGTLLENIVLVEAFRLLAENAPANAPIEFANSFAMPPLSRWRDHRNDSCFCAAQLDALRVGARPEEFSFAALMWHCLQHPHEAPGTHGPNGALLCAMLGHLMGHRMRLWLNDIPEGHYGNAIPDLLAINAHVQAVLDLAEPPPNDVVVCSDAYPASLAAPALNNFTAAIADWGSGAAARLGYLDPMRYRINAPGAAETSSADHRQWLRILAANFDGPAVSVHFTAHNDWNTLRPELEQLRADGGAEGFPHAVTARHSYYHAVALVRGADSLASQLGNRIRTQWLSWCRTIDRPPCKLTVEVTTTVTVGD